MPQQKTSQRTHRQAWLNPATSEADKAALRIIERQEANGVSFKQLAVDNILRCEGIDPATFPRSGLDLAGLEGLLARFADYIISNVGGGGSAPPADPDEFEDEDTAPGKPSKFARGLAASFAARQQGGSE